MPCQCSLPVAPWPKVGSVTNCATKLRAHLQDEKLNNLIRQPDGGLTEEGLELREALSSMSQKMDSALEVVESLHNLVAGDQGALVSRLHDAIASCCVKTPNSAREQCVRFQAKEFAKLGSYDLCIHCAVDNELSTRIVEEKVAPKLEHHKPVTFASLKLDADAAKRFRQEMLYDLVSLVMWNRDAVGAAINMVDALVAPDVPDDLWGDDRPLVHAMVTCLHKEGWATLSAQQLEETRLGVEPGCGLMGLTSRHLRLQSRAACAEYVCQHIDPPKRSAIGSLPCSPVRSPSAALAPTAQGCTGTDRPPPPS